MDSYEGSGEEPLSLHKYLYCQANPPNMVDPSGQNGDFITLVASMAVQMTTQTMNALRGAPAIVAARALPIVTGGTAFFQNYGSRALQYIGSLGSSAIRVLQTAFLRSGNIISQSQALRGQTWNSFRDLKAALNPLVNAGSTANPANIQWHHIVEQGLNLAKFGNNAINSLANVVPTPVAIHRAISGFYGSGPDWIRSLGSFPRVRDYVSSLPWDEQYRIGLEIWKYAMASNGQMSQQAVKQIILGQ